MTKNRNASENQLGALSLSRQAPASHIPPVTGHVATLLQAFGFDPLHIDIRIEREQERHRYKTYGIRYALDISTYELQWLSVGLGSAKSVVQPWLCSQNQAEASLSNSSTLRQRQKRHCHSVVFVKELSRLLYHVVRIIANVIQKEAP